MDKLLQPYTSAVSKQIDREQTSFDVANEVFVRVGGLDIRIHRIAERLLGASDTDGEACAPEPSGALPQLEYRGRMCLGTINDIERVLSRIEAAIPD